MRLLVTGLVWILFVSASLASNTEIRFRTELFPGEHAPNHVLAVWVEDVSGNFVASIAVYAKKRIGYLTQWSASSRGFTGDAVTGETIKVHTSHAVNWDGKDFQGGEVSDGTYFIKMEMCSHDDVPRMQLAFEKTGTNYTKSYEDATYYKDVSIKHEGSSTAISNTEVNVQLFYASLNSESLLIDLRYSILKREHASIRLYDLRGRLLKEYFNGELTAGQHQESLQLPTSIRKGFYILELRTSKEKLSKKLILKQ